MTDIILTIIIIIVLALPIIYIIRAKKNGVKCIGCPSSKICSNRCSSCSSNKKKIELKRKL